MRGILLKNCVQSYKEREKALDCLVTGGNPFVKDTKAFDFLIHDCVIFEQSRTEKLLFRILNSFFHRFFDITFCHQGTHVAVGAHNPEDIVF